MYDRGFPKTYNIPILFESVCDQQKNVLSVTKYIFKIGGGGGGGVGGKFFFYLIL